MAIDDMRAARAFAASEIGKLFLAFERAHANAWQLDTKAGYTDEGISDSRLSEAWKRCDDARKAFLDRIKDRSGDRPDEPMSGAIGALKGGS
jgi:hypothetical protein